MFNVCPVCGIYTEEKEVRSLEGTRAEAICPECGHTEPFLRLPLFLITGASGTGKSTLVPHMARGNRRCVHLESDILWGAAFDDPKNEYVAYRNLWLRLCMNIGQAGKPVALYGSATPGQMEACAHRRYFSGLQYLALVCSPEALAERLRARPGWRQSAGDDFIDTMQRYNAWFIEKAAQSNPAVTLLDTTTASVEETAWAVARWLEERWNPESMDIQ